MMMAIPVENPINEKSYRGFKQMYLNRGYIEEKVILCHRCGSICAGSVSVYV